MKLMLSWLSDYIELPESITEVVEALVRLGLEVENVEPLGCDPKSLYVARVESVERHPHADRLSVCIVRVGNDSFTVVCGAHNVKRGMRTIFAPVGTFLPALNISLTLRDIRGISSEGMLCAWREVGSFIGHDVLREPQDGIAELDEALPLGASLEEALGLRFDHLLEVAITPNRGDCLSVMGIARDLSALGWKKKEKFNKFLDFSKNFCFEGEEAVLKLEVDGVALVGCLIRGVHQKSAPLLIRERLAAVGINSISGLVDLSNYMMLDVGRPSHIFDWGRLQSKNLIVRLSNEGEKFYGLKDRNYKLSKGVLVLSTDDGRIVSVGGVLGSEDSACTEDTQDIFIELAAFPASQITRSSRELNLVTDASYRFSRGVDPFSIYWGAVVLRDAIIEFFGGEAAPLCYAGSVQRREGIHLKEEDIFRLTGKNQTEFFIYSILESLGCVIEKEGEGAWCVYVPSWRSDLLTPACLVEELCRVQGYDLIEEVPFERASSVALSLSMSCAEALRTCAASRGFDEQVTYSFHSEKTSTLFHGCVPCCLKIANPISIDLAVMRQTAVPNLLQIVDENLKRSLKSVHIFEIGPNFLEDGSEIPTLTAVRFGGIHDSWRFENGQYIFDFYDMKADFEALCEASGIRVKDCRYVSGAKSYYHPGMSATVKIGDSIIGYVGCLHPHIMKMDGAYKDLNIFVLEIYYDVLCHQEKNKDIVPFYPRDLQSVERNFVFCRPDGCTAEQFVQAAYGGSVQSVKVFDDHYHAHGEHTIGLAVVFVPENKTFSSETLEVEVQSLLARVKKQTGADAKV